MDDLQQNILVEMALASIVPSLSQLRIKSEIIKNKFNFLKYSKINDSCDNKHKCIRQKINSKNSNINK